MSPSFGRKHRQRPKSTPYEIGKFSDDGRLPQIVLTSQSDASNQSTSPRTLSDVSTPRNLRGISTPKDKPGPNSNLLSSSHSGDVQRPRSNSALSLVEQALAEQGLPQDNSLVATVGNELGDSLNFSKDQLEGAARNIILDFEREAGTSIESPSEARPFIPHDNRAAIEAVDIPYSRERYQNTEERPDMTSYI